eukprot:TRINITY_DN8634_c2_g1_i1.p1 TRINITY_DN8634_c2_g1~~TRINITY_DN8634_c2_g1_i1.p1  ORF type:complete len:125 (+),score=12.66 TRINITY_DN8634_c2_g1_i1:442-816(+)
MAEGNTMYQTESIFSLPRKELHCDIFESEDRARKHSTKGGLVGFYCSQRWFEQKLNLDAVLLLQSFSLFLFLFFVGSPAYPSLSQHPFPSPTPRDPFFVFCRQTSDFLCTHRPIIVVSEPFEGL